MKKILAFILVLVIGLSCISISYANISDDHLQSYIGMWISESCDEDETVYCIIIGDSKKYGRALCLTNYRKSYMDYKSEYFYMTYDESNKCVYLADAADNITFRMKIEDNSLNLYLLMDNRLYISAKKVY